MKKLQKYENHYFRPFFCQTYNSEVKIMYRTTNIQKHTIILCG